MPDIIVKDRDGNDVTHEGASRIRTRTVDGGTKEFVDADNIPTTVETTVELDFSEGDMEVLPGAGEVFSGVNIPKPVNLIPDNIAEGVDIAGIVGSFTGGGQELPAWGSIKYIIPIKQYISKSSNQLITGSLTFKRSTTEIIRVMLYPNPKTTTTSRYWTHCLCYGVDRFYGRDYTITYSSAVSQFYTGSGGVSGEKSSTPTAGNLTEITASFYFNASATTTAHSPSGAYFGIILVIDTAYSGAPQILYQNDYIISNSITVVTP